MSLIRILIVGLLSYFLFKALRSLLGISFGRQKAYSNTHSNSGNNRKRTNSDYSSFRRTRSGKQEKHVQGGEYVDFEEIE